jgi:hypothetical protein
MVDKITLATVSELQSFVSAAAALNSNSDILETAMNNTLSRDGTAPNQMQASLDMNSNRIINLPSPISQQEPVRLVDLNAVAGTGTVTFNALPVGGTTGQVLAKNSNSNYDAVWNNSHIPSGGTANQILKKNSSTDYDSSWVSPSSIPGGFLTGGGASTDNAAVRFDGTTGALVQNSPLVVADTTGALSRSGGGGIPVQGMGSNAAAVAAGNIGEIIQNDIVIGAGPSIISGSAGQVWNSITLSAGVWLVGGTCGVFHDTGSPVFTHMHGDHGLSTTSIQTSPGSGTTTALHITSNNPNGWIFPLGIRPYYLPSGGTINAVATSDLTGGTAFFYGHLWGLRIA